VSGAAHFPVRFRDKPGVLLDALFAGSNGWLRAFLWSARLDYVVLTIGRSLCHEHEERYSFRSGRLSDLSRLADQSGVQPRMVPVVSDDILSHVAPRPEPAPHLVKVLSPQSIPRSEVPVFGSDCPELVWLDVQARPAFAPSRCISIGVYP